MNGVAVTTAWILVLLCCLHTASTRSLKTSCPDVGKFYLAANVSTVHWGYFLESAIPRLIVPSGSEVTVEMITHHAGDDPEKMIYGDAAIEGIFEWGATMAIPTRGATGNGDGVHIMTGPIYVCGAEPGDVLQVDILDLKPRKNPRTGKAYGSNAAARWGYQYRTPFKSGGRREVATIYEIVEDEEGAAYAVPDYQFIYGNTTRYIGPVSNSCVPATGSFPGSKLNIEWKHLYTYRGVNVPCVDGKQTFAGFLYPGVVTQHPTGTEDYSIRGKFVVPANPHIGNMAVAPKYKVDAAVHSVPPLQTGGNVDNRRIGKGATMYYPVEVAGALLSLGDAHFAQGDSELDGTAIETSITARLKLTLHKKGSLPKIVQNLTFPLLENANEYIVHGYAYSNYLSQLDPPSRIFQEGASLDKAFEGVYIKARDWLMSSFNLTEDQAITLITVACDFQVHQVVDGNWGMGVSIPKYVFRTEDKKRFMPAVICGTSLPVPGTTLPTSG